MAGVKGKSGRKYEPDARHAVIQIRLTQEEKAELEKKAKSSGGTIASLVREKVINAGGADTWNEK